MTCKNRNNPIPRAYETPPFYGLQDVFLNIREKGLYSSVGNQWI